jgi:predicted dehydrogenase
VTQAHMPRSGPAAGEAGTETVGVAVVGAGYWGPNLIRNFLNHPGTELIRVCDLDLERARRVVGSRSEVAISSELSDVLGDPEVQAVAVATPAPTHYEIGMACAEADKHLLVEKPLAMTAAEGRALVDATNRRDLVLMCDHTFCYTPAVQTIHQYMHDGELGDLQYFDSIRVNLGLVQSEVDVFWDLAPHDLSILDFILPDDCRPTWVGAYGADPIGAGQACIGYLTLPLNTGAIAHVTVNWLSPSKIRQTVVSGSKRMIVWDDMKPYQRLAVFDSGVDVGPPAVEDEREQLMISYRKGDMISPALPETVEALEGVVAEFAGAVRERRPPLTDGRAGVRILEILEAVSVSLRAHGALVPLDKT